MLFYISNYTNICNTLIKLLIVNKRRHTEWNTCSILHGQNIYRFYSIISSTSPSPSISSSSPPASPSFLSSGFSYTGSIGETTTPSQTDISRAMLVFPSKPKICLYPPWARTRNKVYRKQLLLFIDFFINFINSPLPEPTYSTHPVVPATVPYAHGCAHSHMDPKYRLIRAKTNRPPAIGTHVGMPN